VGGGGTDGHARLKAAALTYCATSRRDRALSYAMSSSPHDVNKLAVLPI
jgi:hypothetical protein